MAVLSSTAAWTSLPPGTRLLTALLVAASTLLLILRLNLDPHDYKAIFGATTNNTLAFPWLVLVPGNAIWYPWTLLTSSFVESNLLEFLVSICTLPLAARYLERVWGQVELLKFVFVTVVASNVIAVVVNVLESFVLGDAALFLYGMDYHGLMGLQVGFLVAFTQLIPEHQVQVFGLIKVRVKSLPMLYVTVSNIACLIGYQSPYILIQFGWLVSWFYLRFIKLNEGGEFRGDRSDTFAFANWFPPFIQQYVARVSKIVFDLAVRFRVLRPWNDLESGAYAGVPGGARAEAERRRAMALKALDQRMAAKPAASSGGTGSTSMAASTSGGAGGSGPSTSNQPRGSVSASTSGQQGEEVPMDNLGSNQKD